MPDRRDLLGAAFAGMILPATMRADSVASADINGFPIDAVTLHGGERLGVEVMSAVGIVGRGVLLDVAPHKSGPLDPGSAIAPADLVAAEARQGVTVGEVTSCSSATAPARAPCCSAAAACTPACRGCINGESRCPAATTIRLFVSVAPWRFKGTTSSPVNPLAMF